MRLWSTLAKATKDRYKRLGVTPQRYNAWSKKPAKKKKKLDRTTYLTAPSDPLKAAKAAKAAQQAPVATRVSEIIRVVGGLRTAVEGYGYVNAGKVQNNIIGASPGLFAEMQATTIEEWRVKARDRAEFQYR